MRLYRSLVIENFQQRRTKDLPTLHLGDTVRRSVLIQEGTKERLQAYQGTLISQRNRGSTKETIKIRRVFQGVGLERTFFACSPMIRNLEVLRRTKPNRAKLYYLRGLKGKAARLTTRLNST